MKGSRRSRLKQVEREAAARCTLTTISSKARATTGLPLSTAVISSDPLLLVLELLLVLASSPEGGTVTRAAGTGRTLVIRSHEYCKSAGKSGVPPLKLGSVRLIRGPGHAPWG